MKKESVSGNQKSVFCRKNGDGKWEYFVTCLFNPPWIASLKPYSLL